MNMYNGDISTRDSCFIENQGLLPGSIYVDEDSVLSQNENNFVSGHDTGPYDSQCTGIMVQEKCKLFDDCVDLCYNFSSSKCDIPQIHQVGNNDIISKDEPLVDNSSSYPSISSSNFYPSLHPTSLSSGIIENDLNGLNDTVSGGCFSDWIELSNAIKDSNNESEGEIYYLCNDSLFDLELIPEEYVPIVIKTNGTTVQCGMDGSRDNHCIIFGGSSHFKIQGYLLHVRFAGLTMIRSNDVSVHAAADSYSVAILYDCELAVSITF